MTQPCTEYAKMESITRSLDRMERGFDRVVDLLQKVADQGARIGSLEDRHAVQYNDTNEIYKRMREVEINLATSGPAVLVRFESSIEELSKQVESLDNRFENQGKKFEKILTFHKLATSKPALWGYGLVSGIVLLGFVIDWVNHKDWILATIAFWKNIL